MTLTTEPSRMFGSVNGAKSNLAGSVNGSSLTLTLATGEGALFPETKTGSASSAGTQTLLNSTGIGSSGIEVGDAIYNKTDDSWAHVVSVSTDSVVTTELQGGADNTWANADEYSVGGFIAQMVQYTTASDETSAIVKTERVHIWKRSSDTLYIVARGFDSETAKAFNSGDFVYLMVDALQMNEIQKALAKLQYIVEQSVWRDGSRSLNNNVALKARNNAGSANVDLFKLTTGDIMEFQVLPRLSSGRSISNNNDLIDKAYYEANLPTSPTVTVGENIDGSTTPQAVYISNGANSRTAGRVYKADADDTTNEAIKCDGFVIENKTTGQTTGMVKSGLLTFSGLTAGATYYLSTTAGAISTTWSPIKVGVAKSTTELVVQIEEQKGEVIIDSYQISADISEIASLTAGTITSGYHDGDGSITHSVEDYNGASNNNLWLRKITPIDSLTYKGFSKNAPASNSETSSPNGGAIYVGSDYFSIHGTTIYKNGTATNITSGNHYAMGWDPTNSYLLVKGSTTTVKRYTVSGTTLTLVDTITLSSASSVDGGMAYDSLNQKYYCVHISGGTTTVNIYGSTGTLERTISINSDLHSLFVSIAFVGKILYALVRSVHGNSVYTNIEWQLIPIGGR